MAKNIKKVKLTIFSSFDCYDEKVVEETREMLAECNDCDVEDIDDERVYQCILDGLYDEVGNLDIEGVGYIVGFVDGGFWYGRRKGGKIIGTNINKVLTTSFGCDDVCFYADKYNVRAEGAHHDGWNYVVYRYVDTYEKAERIVDDIVNGVIDTEAKFFKRTKSIRPFVAATFGWKEYGTQAHNTSKGKRA